jgi:hypothetical protein
MFTGYIVLVILAVGSIGGGLYLFGEAKSSHDRRHAIEKMYDSEKHHHSHR